MPEEIQHSSADLFCQCASCSGFNPDATLDASLDVNAGGYANNKPIWTEEQIAAYLNRTSGQYGTGPGDLLQRGGDPNVITFGFHENQQSLVDNGYVYARNGQLFAFSEYFQFGSFTTAQRAATREAISYWDDVLAVDFVETHANQGDINFGNLTNSPNTQAYSRIPTSAYGPGGANANFYGNQIAGLAGDVWVSISQASNFQFDEGGYGLNTLVHEIGHSLGLSHPGGYNFGPGFAVTYANGAEYAQDARNYTIMSYWNPRDMGSTATGVPTRDFDWSLMQIAYGSTPMIHDILAAQIMYGAEMTTRTGDTTYGFNSNAGRDAFDFTKTPWPTMTIWDAGGNDTLDASGYAVTQIIDLTPGSLSSIGGITAEQAATQLTFTQINANRAASGLPPVTQATYAANMAAFNADPEWRGRLTDNVGIAYGAVIENAKGGSGKDTIYGNHADNVLEGNDGNDILFGMDGNDSLFGGNGNDIIMAGEGIDRMWGGAGNDVFVVEVDEGKIASKYGQISLDLILDFAAGDRIDLSGIDANSLMAGDQAFNFVGHANGGQAGDLSLRTFGNVNAAQNALGVDLSGFAHLSGPVTFLLGNTDGDKDPEFLIVMNGNQAIDNSVFIL
ncbi:MAG: M10 family metallopeptidase C-terminal domain-containing protein [Sphingosinicella sp.]|nr:M10 family metallopeptidase C-terminal domain-containing protein [Sphingosinicella sp.]